MIDTEKTPVFQQMQRSIYMLPGKTGKMADLLLRDIEMRPESGV